MSCFLAIRVTFFYNMGEMSSVLFPYYQYIAELYISFLLYFLEISSESMATKEATEIKEAVAAKAPIKEEDTAKALEKED